MAGEIGNTVQDYVNQTVGKGDAPAQENGGAPGDQAVRSPQVDKRAILAVILALKEKESFVLKYSDIEDALKEIIEDEDEYYKVRDGFYDLLYNVRNLKYIYYIYEDEDDSGEDMIVVSPVELGNREISTLEDVANLRVYGFYYKGDEEERDRFVEEEEVIKVINSLIREWALGCRREVTPALTVYVIAKEYGLDVREVGFIPATQGTGAKVTYSIEDVVEVMQSFWYCNDCVWQTGSRFVEVCETWFFVNDDDEEGGET